MSGCIKYHLEDLMLRGTYQRYFPNLIKIILVYSERNVLWDYDSFKGMGLKAVTGSCYLGGLLGYVVAQKDCLGDKIQGCLGKVRTLTGVACRDLQSAYYGTNNSLQQ